MRQTKTDSPKSTSGYRHTFSQGPSIAVHILEDALGWKVSLTNHDCFSLFIPTEIPEAPKTKILYWLERYSKKSPTPVDFLPRQKLPPFTQTVIKTLIEVPFGHVLSYSQLATLSGSPRACRAVGTVCHNNRFPLFIPCHRIIHHTGRIGGFALNLSIKEKLLAFESKQTP